MIRGFLAVLRRLRVPASSLPPASSHRGDNSIGVQEPRKLADVLDAKRPLWPQGNFDHLLYLAGILAGIDEFVDHAEANFRLFDPPSGSKTGTFGEPNRIRTCVHMVNKL